MKKQTDLHQNENEETFKMPDDWTPEQDNDAQWKAIVSLLKEANEPTVPEDQEFDELLIASKFLSHNPDMSASVESVEELRENADEFGPWVKSVAVGGGVYAQVLRFAAIAAATVLVTLSISNQSATPLNDSINDGAVANNPIQTDPVASVASATEAEPVDTEPAKPKVDLVTNSPVSPDLGGGAFTVSNDWRGLKSDPAWNNALVYSSKLNDNAFLYGYDTMPQQQQQPAEMGNSPTPFAKQRLLSLMQQLRFQSQMNPNTADMETIRQMESALRPLLQEGDAVSQTEIYALELYQKAEEMMERNRYDDAITILEEIDNIVPSSFMAFLSQYRIASIEFEQLQQFDLALSDYQEVLKVYPTHFLSETHKSQIIERVELLTKNYEPGWEGLTTWQNAQKLSGKERFDLLKYLIEEHPQLPVASKALNALMDQVLTDPTDQWVSPEEVTRLASFMITASPQHPNGAQILFTQGEVAFRRMYDIKQAKRAFEQVTAKSGGEKFTELVDRRLTQIARAEKRKFQ